MTVPSEHCPQRAKFSEDEKNWRVTTVKFGSLTISVSKRVRPSLFLRLRKAQAVDIQRIGKQLSRTYLPYGYIYFQEGKQRDSNC